MAAASARRRDVTVRAGRQGHVPGGRPERPSLSGQPKQMSLSGRPERPSLPSALLIGAVRGYQLFLSPWLGNRCRHMPSCSAYAVEALRRFGALRGGWLAIRRIGRCHPWGTWGYDPVPDGGSAPGLDGGTMTEEDQRRRGGDQETRT